MDDITTQRRTKKRKKKLEKIEKSLKSEIQNKRTSIQFQTLHTKMKKKKNTTLKFVMMVFTHTSKNQYNLLVEKA